MEDPVACSISLNLLLLEMSLSMAERPGQPNGPIKVVFVYAKTRGCIIMGPESNMLVSYPSEAHIFRGVPGGRSGGGVTPGLPKKYLYFFFLG